MESKAISRGEFSKVVEGVLEPIQCLSFGNSSSSPFTSLPVRGTKRHQGWMWPGDSAIVRVLFLYTVEPNFDSWHHICPLEHCQEWFEHGARSKPGVTLLPLSPKRTWLKCLSSLFQSCPQSEQKGTNHEGKNIQTHLAAGSRVHPHLTTHLATESWLMIENFQAQSLLPSLGVFFWGVHRERPLFLRSRNL